jgi:RNA polymerase sigma-70 factor (ECF subfamily)
MIDFHALYERYSAPVRRFALFLSGDAFLADDITSEVFVRAWVARDRIEQATMKAYLFTIARNLYHDSQRHARRHTALPQAVPDIAASAVQHAEMKADLALVLDAMQKLPEIDRAALLMRAQEEMSYEEIARALALSPAAVRVKVHRARLRLAMQTGLGQGKSRKTEGTP